MSVGRRNGFPIQTLGTAGNGVVRFRPASAATLYGAQTPQAFDVRGFAKRTQHDEYCLPQKRLSC